MKRLVAFLGIVMSLVAAGLLLVVIGAEAQVSTEISCFIQGIRVESQKYDAARKTATVVLTFAPDGTLAPRECLDQKDGFLRVTGIGFPPPNAINPRQAEERALRGARDDALGKLAECLCGVKVKIKPAK